MVERTERRPRGGAGRVPPHNVEAESSLLGALLLSPDAIAAVAEMGLGPEDFYKPAHQFIYDAIRTLLVRRAGSTPSPSPTSSAEPGCSRTSAARASCSTCRRRRRPSRTPAATPRIVRDTALLRRLIGVAGEIAEIAYDEPDDVTKALDEAENKVFQLADHQVVDSTRPLSDLARRGVRRPAGGLRAGQRPDRRAHGFHRSRRAALRPAAIHAERRRRPPEHGQDRVRPQHRHPCGASTAGCPCCSSRWRWATRS